MINWEKSAKLNGANVSELKSYFDKYPVSNKRIIAICDNCSKERNVSFYQYRDLCHKCAVNIPEYLKLMMETKKELALKEKSPIPEGYKINKESNMVVNKNCAQYLGCYIAEQLLAKVFKNVKRMPHGNNGYDIICNNGYKIDIKSSATGYKGYWNFNISRNEIADYFLCVSFEDRNNLKPTHLWLIPGDIINHLMGLTISKSTTYKWSKYEQPLDKVLLCCNSMKEKK